jgi:hypothetical protein
MDVLLWLAYATWNTTPQDSPLAETACSATSLSFETYTWYDDGPEFTET